MLYPLADDREDKASLRQFQYQMALVGMEQLLTTSFIHNTFLTTKSSNFIYQFYPYYIFDY